jgi:hypothetical protein
MNPTPTFTEIKQKVVAGMLYTIIYDGPTYHAEIIGLCQSWVKTIALDSATFTLKNK